MNPHRAIDGYDDVLKKSTLASSLSFIRCRVNIGIHIISCMVLLIVMVHIPHNSMIPIDLCSSLMLL